MLTDLIIRNFAIIDRLQVSFGAGFNVLTGETGAGKSIVIDAVGLLLGERARPDLIRTGEDEAVVEALFDLSQQPELQHALAEAGFEGGAELLVRRVVSRSGKNKVFINGSLATLAQLQPLTAGMMTIYGQHAQQGLQRTELHLALLDQFAGSGELLDHYRGHYQDLLELQRRLRHLDEAERERQQRLEFLSFQSREIGEINPKPGEDEELAAERLLLLHQERLAAATSGGFGTLYGDDGAICEKLEGLAANLESLTEVDPRLGALAETLRSSLYSLEDVANDLRDYGRQISFEPGHQNEVEERLAQLALLKRKYAPSIEAVLVFKEKIDAELEELADIDAAREAISAKLAEATRQMRTAGEALSQRRQQAAGVLKQRVERELGDLAMGKARFEMRLTLLPEPGPKGLEAGEFFLSPNPGEEPKSLARIASGGELSRIMLALKGAAPEGDGLSTLVFDEVDAGIGGEAATAVGEKLRGVARGKQVLCITHLPQVAAFGDLHYRVEKGEQGGRTRTSLVLLDEEGRTREMARMLGGARVTERTLEHARELIGLSRGC